MVGEVWKSVVGYEGLYSVSNMGRVKSHDRTSVGRDGKTRNFKGRQMRINKSGDGYMKTSLTENGITKAFLIHRLSAKAFLGNHKHLQVNHIDEDRANNKLDNLEWVTPRVNINYRQDGYTDDYLKANIEKIIDIVGVDKFKELVDEVIN